MKHISKLVQANFNITGVATISQGQHVTSYDGKEYDLDGSCMYLLSRDLQDGNFTIVLDNGDLRTLNVLSGGQAVSVDLNGQVGELLQKSIMSSSVELGIFHL